MADQLSYQSALLLQGMQNFLAVCWRSLIAAEHAVLKPLRSEICWKSEIYSAGCRHLAPAVRQRPRLVEGHDLHAGQRLQHLASLDQDAAPCGPADGAAGT